MPELIDGIHRLLSPEELARLDSLAIGSRFAVEGAMSGAHRSPLKGFSAEFADHKSYTPGDDPKHLDWKILARNERLYIRQYEEETSLRLTIFLDASQSMSYAGGAEISKFDFAARSAAALAYIAVRHQDNVGLAVFADRLLHYLPARGGAEHLRILSNTLANTRPGSSADYAGIPHQLAEKIPKRGLIAFFTDGFTSPELIRANLAHFRRRRHDVILYHILDPWELEFPFRDTCAFRDLESDQIILTSAREIREAYLENLHRFLDQLQRICSENDIEYVQLRTSPEVVPQILKHLLQRKQNRR